MARYRIGRVDDFPRGSRSLIELGGRTIGVFNIGDKLYALPNVCPHQNGPLCEGKRLTGTLEATKESAWRPRWIHDGEILVCPWHGLEYHVPTGQCLAWPRVRLRRFPIVIEGEDVSVEVPWDIARHEASGARGHIAT